MNIACIVSQFPLLSETFVLNQITGLIDRGHDVTIWARSPGNQPVTHADVERYNLLDRTFYYGGSCQAMPTNILLRFVRAIGPMARNCCSKAMPMLRSLNVLRFGRRAVSLRIFYKTLPFLEQDMSRYDIVHCHFGPNGNLGALLKEIGVIEGKVVTTFYGKDLSKDVEKRGNSIYGSLFKVGDVLVPISDRMQRQLIELGCEEHKIVVHRLGVDMSMFPFHPRKLRGNGKVNLLTVARLAEKKGVQYSIRAVAKALIGHPQIEYKIAGDGPLRSELISLIGALGITDRVKLLGWKQQREIAELMKEADILLAPSVTSKDGDQEGTPTVVIEALARGLPVLSTWHSGIPELVQDGESGFLVPERDVDALAEKLEFLIRHHELWPEMGRAGRDFVERHHDIDRLNDQLVELYRRLLDGQLP